MNIWVDTEFTDFVNCELISIAAVINFEKHFYGAVTDYDKKMVSQFVKDEVLPIVHNHPLDIEDKFSKVAAAFVKWLKVVAPKEQITFCIDYVSDMMHIRNLLSCAKFNHNRVQYRYCDPYSNPVGKHEYNSYFINNRSAVRHNALDDAFALRRGSMAADCSQPEIVGQIYGCDVH